MIISWQKFWNFFQGRNIQIYVYFTAGIDWGFLLDKNVFLRLPFDVCIKWNQAWFAARVVGIFQNIIVKGENAEFFSWVQVRFLTTADHVPLGIVDISLRLLAVSYGVLEEILLSRGVSSIIWMETNGFELLCLHFLDLRTENMNKFKNENWKWVFRLFWARIFFFPVQGVVFVVGWLLPQMKRRVHILWLLHD